MIVVKVTGGLGNQMFQYAMGRSLALRRGVPLKLDLSFFAGPRRGQFALDQWNTEFEEATEKEVDAFRGVKKRPLAGFLRRGRATDQRPVIIEKDFGFHREVLDAPGDCYLDGYWQNEGYFVDIGDRLREEFTPRLPMSEQARAFVAQVESAENPVLVHIRRGDYVSSKYVAERIGSLPMGYYHRAAARMAEVVANPHFFLSSDEPEWVAEKLKLAYASTIVPDLGRQHACEQLTLNRACKHFILANSSFSWWSAWLSENPGKHIIGPEPWMRDPAWEATYSLPSAWEVIAVEHVEPDQVA
jgi:hypothetical protein